MPYFGRWGQSGKEATRQLSGLPLHLGWYRGHCEPPVRSKPNLMNQLRMQHPDIFWEYSFLKLVNGCFCDTETFDHLRLNVQNIKHLMHLERNLCLSQRNFI